MVWPGNVQGVGISELESLLLFSELWSALKELPSKYKATCLLWGMLNVTCEEISPGPNPNR